MGVLIALMIALLVVCIVQGQPIAKVLVLAVLIMPLALLFVESFVRRVVINQDGVMAFRLFRQTQIFFADVTSLETVRVRSRVFMTLAAGDDDFLIISNSYAEFPALVKCLIDAVPEESVTEETQKLAEKPPLRHADVYTVWFAVIALVYILVAQFKI
jgi:hypothetical protein